jgi:hypothetical protein
MPRLQNGFLSLRVCIACVEYATLLEGLHSRSYWKLAATNLLEGLSKGFIVNPADLPWKWVEGLATSGERVNYGSWWKCTTSVECKTGISAVLTDTSGLDSLWNRWTLKIIDCCYILFLFTWSCGYLGLC